MVFPLTLIESTIPPQTNPSSNTALFTAFSLYSPNGGLLYLWPEWGYDGAMKWYNNMQGLTYDGNPYIDPTTGLETKYCVPGDPESDTGWYEGNGWPGGLSPMERLYSLSFGPLTMAPGDTQEVVIAIFMAIGTNHLNSVTELKNKAVQIHHYYGNDYITKFDKNAANIPVNIELLQNYPNPFNPVTTIEYSITTAGKVELTVYDILGREVATLVNENKKPGIHQVVFDASNYTSGLYFYRLKTAQQMLINKMMLLK